MQGMCAGGGPEILDHQLQRDCKIPPFKVSRQALEGEGSGLRTGLGEREPAQLVTGMPMPLTHENRRLEGKAWGKYSGYPPTREAGGTVYAEVRITGQKRVGGDNSPSLSPWEDVPVLKGFR